MASLQVRTRADGTPVYRVLFRLDGKQTTETFDEYDGAEELLADIKRLGLTPALRRLANRRSTTAATIPTLADYARRHVQGLSGITDGTRRDYLTYITRDLDKTVLGQTRIDQVTRPDVAAWVTDLHVERGLSGKSIRNRHALISATFTNAVLDKIRPDNPCVSIRLPRTESTAHKVFVSSSEFAILLDQIDPFWRPLVTFLYSTGCRWGEATALKIRDVDLNASPPSFDVVASWKHTAGRGHEIGPPKTKKGQRTVGISPQLHALLRPLIAGRGRDELVFVNRQGNPIRHNSFYLRVWVPAVDKAEPLIHKRPRIHDCRHSAASNMLKDGVPINVIQEILGHESIQTTVDTYGKTAANALMIATQAAALSLVEAYPEIEGSEDLPDYADDSPDEIPDR